MFSTLAKVYVFADGISGSGLFGFQADVFDNPPATPGYRPVRALVQASWRNSQSAPLLESSAEVRTAEGNGELSLARLGGPCDLHLTCPARTASPHLLAFHTGGVFLAAMLGLLISRIPAFRLRRERS